MSKLPDRLKTELDESCGRIEDLITARLQGEPLDFPAFINGFEKTTTLCKYALVALSGPAQGEPGALVSYDYASEALLRLIRFSDALGSTEGEILRPALDSPAGKIFINKVIEELQALRQGLQFARNVARAPSLSEESALSTAPQISTGESPFELSSGHRGIASVWFATNRFRRRNRSQEFDAGNAKFEDGRGAEELSVGVAEVSFPASHRIGEVERPSFWKLEFKENVNKHVVIQSCQVDMLSSWKASAEIRMQETDCRSALVFIHGYNVGFDEAVRRTAQIGFDIGFDGLLTCFSWASENSTRRYLADLDNADQAGPQLAELLSILSSELKIGAIHIVAHSMGNRVLLAALERLQARHAKGLGEVVMAAPDVDCDSFAQVFPRIQSKARRYTLYGSAKDKALLASKRMRSGYPRLGDGGQNIYVANGVESLDATDVSLAAFDVKHSYPFEHRQVLSDLHYVIRTSTPVKKRNGLKELVKKQVPYWKFV